MLAVKISDYRGNVINQKSDDNKWYLEFIRNPNISSDAKIVFLNLRTNDKNYNENIKSLMFKCNLSENLVSKALKELEILKLVSRKREHVLGRYQWQYITNIDSIQYPINKGVVNKGIVTDRYKYNSNINKKKVSKEEETNQLSEIENVENSIIEFADKADEEKIRNEFDNLLDGRLQIQANLIDALKKKSSDFRKVRPVDKSIELIKLLPEFVKASKLKNTDKNYEDKQSLTYLVKILENPLGNYPKWFLDSQKQSLINKEVDNLTQSWKPITTIWNTNSFGRIDNCIKAMIEKILTFITESENNKKSDKKESVFLARFRGVFTEACINTLKVKKLSEMIEIINEYINKEWNKSDTFNEVIENFNKSGSSLETISLYFSQAKAGV